MSDILKIYIYFYFYLLFYAENFVGGFQGTDETYLRASSCLKHYAGYSLENADGYNRHNFNAIISDYDLNDTYLPAFKYNLFSKFLLIKFMKFSETEFYYKM